MFCSSPATFSPLFLFCLSLMKEVDKLVDSKIGMLFAVVAIAVIVLCLSALVNALSSLLSIGALSIVAVVAIVGIVMLSLSIKNKD